MVSLTQIPGAVWYGIFVGTFIVVASVAVYLTKRWMNGRTGLEHKIDRLTEEVVRLGTITSGQLVTKNSCEAHRTSLLNVLTELKAEIRAQRETLERVARHVLNGGDHGQRG